MKEDLLHFVWRTKRLDTAALHTTEGQDVIIENWGTYNLHEGPDFHHARIRITGTLWVGQVEMHLKSSDWMQHRHQEDDRYANVILHVVLEEDEVIRLADGSRLPCLELRNRIPQTLVANYLKLMALKSWIPCQEHLAEVPVFIKEQLLERMLVERMERRTAEIRSILEKTEMNWEESFYRLLMKSMGFKVNGEPMGLVAESIPLRLLLRHRNRVRELEAMLFGVAGLLNQIYADDYPAELQRTFFHLQKKYQLDQISPHHWRWMRSRPANFPSIRLAQFARMISERGSIFSRVLDFQSIGELVDLFSVAADDYWIGHYRFDIASKKRPKSLGKDSIHRILINCVLPFLFYYAGERELFDLRERVIEVFFALPAENNKITRKWAEIGMPNDNAGQSQGLLELKSKHCDQHFCLRCPAGTHILAL